MSNPGSVPPNPGLSGAALRGAVDLGAVAQAREAQAAAQARAQAGGSAAGGDAGAGALVIDVTTEEFQTAVLEQSLTVPVVLDLWATWCGPCKQLSPLLEKLANEYAGKFILAKVDVDAEQQIAAAFQVQSIPSVFAIIKGQPVPLFQGALPEAQIRQYLDEVLKVAAENGVTGTAGPAADAADADADASDEPEPTHPADEALDAAADAIEAGNWAQAEAEYRRALDLRPDDADARAGLVLVSVQDRLRGIDAGQVLRDADAHPGNVTAAITAADVHLSTGDFGAAYDRLLKAIKASSGEDRDAARERLLELFSLAAPDDPEVARARRALAAALY